MPPLRERREDIPALVEHFALQVSAVNGWKPMPFTPDAMAGLQQQPWPGNVRELRNAVERLMLLATSDEVTAETVAAALPVSVASPDSAAGIGRPRARLRETNYSRGVETQSPPDFKHSSGAGVGTIASL
ncbi:MAG: hypothetical protein ABSC07_18990 [Terriglobales bacterium]